MPASRQWKIGKESWDITNEYWTIEDEYGRVVSMEPVEFYAYIKACGDKADAELIVRAVNCHDDLLDVCRMVVNWLDHCCDNAIPAPGWLNIVEAARAAIAKAETED